MNNFKERYNAISDRIKIVDKLSKTKSLSIEEKQNLILEAVQLGISLAQLSLDKMSEERHEKIINRYGIDDGF